MRASNQQINHRESPSLRIEENTLRYSDSFISGVATFRGLKPLPSHLAIKVNSPARVIVHEVSADKYRASFFDNRKGPVADLHSVERQ